MRIAVVTVSLGSHVRTYVDYLVSRGHDVTVITHRNQFQDSDVPTHDISPLGGWKRGVPKGVHYMLRDRNLRAALESGGYDVVSVQMFTMDGVTTALYSPVPVVLTFLGSDVYLRHTLPPRYLANYEAALQRADVIHACSQHMADELISLGAPHERVVNFQYGIDLGLFRPRVEPSARRMGRIVSNRSLRPLYRVHLLAEAMPLVLAEEPDARLAIYGHGSEEERIRGIVERTGTGEAVEFAGFPPHEVLAEDLGSAAVWASLAESDGTPLSMLEAIASGAFPVAADLPTLREWLEPPRGVLIAEPTAESVAAGLVEGLRAAESGAHIGPNRRLVENRGDMVKNLARFEGLLIDAANGRLPRPDDIQ